MANQPGQRLPPDRFQPGQELTADALSRIVQMLTRRITGGKGVRIRTFGDQIIIEVSPSRGAGAPAAGLPVHDPTPDVTVGTTAETEAAQTDDWDVGDGTLKVTQQTRTAYSDTGGQILYAYYRDFYYAADGRLTRVSGETRVTIDTPAACP